MTREEALDVLRRASANRHRIKLIEEKLASGRRFFETVDEMRDKKYRLERELVSMKEDRREAMRIAGWV